MNARVGGTRRDLAARLRYDPVMPAFEVLVGRIETLAVDAVVNAANRWLALGSGVDGALRAAAGPELTRLTQTMGPLAEGEAVMTPGFKLPAKHIIHVAAPIWFAAGEENTKIAALGACYANALKLADKHALESIAFPCLGTGNFGWPGEIACRVALEHARAAGAQAENVARVMFCCFTAADAALYAAATSGNPS